MLNLEKILLIYHGINAKVINSLAKTTEIAPEEIGKVGYVSQSVVIQTKTGTGPFDGDNNPGNDKDEDNNIVRSFDQITYTVENTTKLKEAEEGKSYKGGVLQIKAVLPQELAGSARWDLNSMAWAEDAVLSEDGLTFTAKYPLSKWVVTVPGKQTISYVVQVLGAKNNTEITPTFTTSLVGNAESEGCITTAPITKVSAAPKLNVQIKKMSDDSLNYKGYFEPSSGNEVSSKTATSIYGRMQGYGITLQLYNTTEDKALKGIEIPKGNITFDISLAETLGTTDVTSQANYKPVLWDYNENITSNYGKNGKRFDWNGYTNSTRATVAAPYNSMQEDLPDIRKVYECCYNGGSWTLVQDSSNKTLYHVTVNGYEFDPNLVFPINNGARNNPNLIEYGKNIGSFSSGFIQVIAQTPETVTSTEDLYLRATVSNLRFTSLSDEIQTEDQQSSDDESNKNITLYPPGALSKAQWFNNKNTTEPIATANAALSSTNQSGDAYISKNSEFYMESLITYTNGDTVFKRYNVLQKFDDKGIEPLDDSNTNSARYKVGRSSIAEQGNVKVLYAAKPNKKGWTNDTEMQNTREEELVYFTTYAELKEQGYTCVGILYENTNAKLYSGVQVAYDIKMKVKDTAKIGNVYATTNDFRAWATDQDFTWEGKTFTYNNNTLQYNNLNYPSVDRYIYNNNSSTAFKMYTKTEYDENGQIVDGTHGGGFRSGSSLLIVGADLKVNREINDKVNEEPKVNYDLGKNELEAEYKITPSLTNDKLEAGSISGIKVKITDTLPKGLTYIEGSSNSGEPAITSNSDGTTTLVWYKENCSVNNEIEPIIYKAKIDETTKNGVQYLTNTLIEEVILPGQTSDIGTSPLTARTSTNTIQIVNLATYNLYKTTNTPLIETNGIGKFKVTAVNITDNDVTDFQLLDVLPYNGDGRGTNYNGTYEVSKITLKQVDSNTGATLPITNLKLYKTTDETVRDEGSCKDTNFATGTGWTLVTSGQTINESIVGFAVKGTLSKNAKLEIDIVIKTNGNKTGDIYQNQSEAQTNIETDPMISPIVGIEVINRTVEGTIWEDTNKDGLISQNETKIKDVEVSLVNEDGTPAKDVDGQEIVSIKTNQDGYYKFDKIAKGNYKVKVTVPSGYDITNKNIGEDETLNSKINTNGETDVITGLNTSEPAIVKNQNAGLVLKGTKLIVKHYIEGTETHVLLKTGGEAQDEVKNGKVGDSYETSPVEPADQYELVATPTNSTGNMTEDEIVVIYYYRLKKYPYTVNYYDKDTKEIIKDTKKGSETTYGTKIKVEDEKEVFEKYEFVSSNVNGNETATELSIGTNVNENVINLYYVKKKGKVITKYIDKNTNKEIEERNETTDKVDEPYTTEKKTINNYTFVESTNNTEGIYTKESVNTPIIVIYYYKQNARVIVNHIDKNTGEKIPEADGKDSTVTKNGLVGDSYTSASKSFENYVLVEKPNEETVTLTPEEIVLNYYYTYSSAQLLEKHIDDITGDILYNEGHAGNVGDSYNIPSKTFEGYDLVETKLPTNSTGTFTKDKIEVVYYYKHKANVIAKYVDKDTKKEIEKQEEIVGHEKDSYITNKKTIDGYTYVEDTGNTEGEMTRTTIEVIYYYKKNASVLVHHYIEGTEKNVPLKAGGEAKDETKNGKVGDKYQTNPVETAVQYELVAIPKNKDGEMTQDQIVVTYFYKLKEYPYTVNYYDKDTNEKIKTTKQGKSTTYGNQIKVQDEKVDIAKYEYVSSDVAGNEQATELKIGTDTSKNVINLYYVKKKGKVITKYIDKNTGKEIEKQNETTGKVDEEYKTEQKTINGYTFVESTNNTEGLYTEESVNKPIEVIYYYKQNAKVIVNHIDKNTGKKIPEANGNDSTVTKDGLVGDKYTSTSKNFENYVLVEKPSEENVILKPEETILNYYYKHISAGVTEKHVDDITGEVLYNEEHTGNEGDSYNIPSKTFEGYELVEEKLPTNSSGKMTKEPITVIYYYRYPSKVTVKYIDKKTGKEIPNPDGTPTKEEKTGYVGEDYKTEPKDLPEYDLIEEELPKNSEGKITKEEIEVKYYYIQKSAGVTENHYDIKTGEKLVEEKKYTGHVGDKYETSSKVIEGYELIKVEKDNVEVKDKSNIKGEMTAKEIKADYYYIKKTNVTVKYVDKLTKKEIEDPTNIPGVEGDEYTTEPKEIPGYDRIKEEDPDNKEGKMTKEPIEVVYYYKKKATVEVRYLDEETEEDIQPSENITGYVKDDYKTEKKNIKNYNFVRSTDNTEGKMGEEKIVVKYIYKKKTFNLKAEKKIASVIINGVEKKANKDIVKKEIKKKEISSTNLKVKYKITVINDGELAGTGTIRESIPDGLEMKVEDNKEWTISGKDATIEIENLNPGESRDYEVVLTWKNTGENFGTKKNNVELINLKNEAGFEESNKNDNTDDADLILSVSTGAINPRNGIILIIAIFTLFGIKAKKQKSNISKKGKNRK